MRTTLTDTLRRALAPLAILLVLFGAFALSACGDDDDSGTDTQGTQTEAQSGDDGVNLGKVAAATASFLVVRRQLNKREAEMAQLEAEVEKANAEAEKAQAEAEKAKAQAADAEQDADQAQQAASSASDVAKAEAEAEQAKADAKAAEAKAEEADAQKREYQAKAEAAAGCAQAMLEIIGKVPKADSLEDGLQQAGEDLKDLAPKCEESLAEAGT